MIACDVCWNVLGKTRNKPLIGIDLFYIGHWEVCKECLNRYVDIVFEDVRSKEFKKN